MKSAKPLEWKINIEFKQKLKLEEAKFIFAEAEKAFNDSIDTSIRILNRNSSLFQLVAGILIGLVAYAIGKWEKNADFDSLLITAISGIAYYLLLGLVFIFPNIKPTEYVLPGTQPKRLFVDAIFNTPDDKDKREVLLYIIKITNLQAGIDSNRAINDKRWEYYKRSLNFLFYSPIVLICIYILSSILHK
jgi:hypothetical protein